MSGSQGHFPQEARFIYTSEKGFVDSLHFFSNAKRSATYGDLLTIADYAVETGQLIVPNQRHSAFSYEDIRSNRLGREFGQSVSSDKQLSQHYSEFMQKIGASTNPETDIKSQHPGLWESIPEETTKGKLLPESKRCYLCSGPALPNEGRGFLGGIREGVGNFIGRLFR